MAKKPINKIADKLNKVNESFSVNMYDNGFMIEVSGRDSNNEYKTAKVMVGTVDELIALVKEVSGMERDE
jgi:hypothetical protein